MATESHIFSAFCAGGRASEKGHPIAICPYDPLTLRWWAWTEGWYEEEGPRYRLTAAGEKVRRRGRATLADVWPA